MKSIKMIMAVIFAALSAYACFSGAFVTAVHGREAPANIAAALIVKLAALEKNMSGSSKDLTVYVLGASEVANELKKLRGRKIGSAELKNVVLGNGLPENRPDILFVGSDSQVNDAIAYTRSKKCLSVAGIPELVEKGITLGIGIGENGKPQILLNLSSTLQEGMDWNPAILKFAKTVK